MKKTLTIILSIAALFCLFRSDAFSYQVSDSEGRRILDNLYISPGRLPVNDLVADMEIYTPLEGQEGGSSLQLASKDKLIFKRPNKLKVDSIINDPGGALDGKQMTIIRDGAQRWLYVSAGQYPVKKGPDEPSATLNLPPYLQTYKQDSVKVYTMGGKGQVGDVPAKIVKISDPSSNEVTTIWVDTKRWVPLKLEKNTPDPKGGANATIKTCYYKQFKKLQDGRWFPTTIEVQEGDITRKMISYKAISVNVGISDDIFEPMKKFVK